MNFLRPRKTALDEPLYKLSAGRSFFRKMVQIRRHFATRCTIRGTRGAKLQADATFSGRSMVEMLGVLAIIGVLSVGAITGYSKAMMKYKLNKQTEQLNQVFTTALKYSPQWKISQSTNILPYLIKLKEIPDEMIATNNQNNIYDVFNNRIFLDTYQQSITSSQLTEIDISLDTSKGDDYSLSICRNIFNIAKELHQNLSSISMINYGTTDESTSAQAIILWGDYHCSSGKTSCIKDAGVAKIDEICRSNMGKNNNPHIEIIFRTSL